MATKETTSADGAKYRRIIDAAEKRLDKEIREKEKRDERGDYDDEVEGHFRNPEVSQRAIARHRSFLPFVEAGLLPASIAIRMAVEGRSALDEEEEEDE